MTTDPIIPTAERTLRLVELLQARPEGWTPQELLPELDLSRSALFVLLRALKALGYVEQTGKRGRYIPGPRLLAWQSPQTPSSQDLLTAFYQEAELNAGAPGSFPRETLALVLPAGEGGCVVAAQVEGASLVRSSFTPGQIYPQSSNASPLLAALQVLNANPALEIRTQGHSLAFGAETIDLALPVCRDGHTPEAALLLSAPAFRWTAEHLDETFLPGLREMAAHLSYRLGAPVYAPYRTQPRDRLQTTASLGAEEISAFLRGPYAASLACIRPDGKPHVIPVWQEWDGQDFFVIAWQGAQWAEYIEQNPNVSLTIDEPWAPLRRVVVQGCARPVETAPAALDRLIQRLTRRYLGQPGLGGLSGQVQRAFRIHPDSLRGYRGLL